MIWLPPKYSLQYDGSYGKNSKNNHNEFKNRGPSFSWVRCEQCVLDLHPCSCPKTNCFLELFGFLQKSLTVPNLFNLWRKWKGSHAIQCIDLDISSTTVIVRNVHTNGAGGLGLFSPPFSLIFQVSSLPTLHQAAKALSATLYDLCLSFIYSKCICLYILICCSLPPLSLGEV